MRDGVDFCGSSPPTPHPHPPPKQPIRYARLAAKLFFWPTIPITILNRWSNYWTAVDGTLLMGAAPLASLGHVEV